MHDASFFHGDPIVQFEKWYEQARPRGWRRIWTLLNPVAALHQPDAMTLATATTDGAPSARMVLFKGLLNGEFTFYTNYESRKGRELAVNPRAALVFHWGSPERQVRVEGKVARLSYEASQAYWKTRPRGSQLSGAASKQSVALEGREAIERQIRDLAERYRGSEIPCPKDWGGYAVTPHAIEFWEARINRIHDRMLYTRSTDTWRMARLAP